jgi:phage shock protein A
MKEGIIRRVGRIISGSFNSVVDAVENAAPETVMEEAIREIDEAIDDVRAELGRVVANQHIANNRLSTEKQKYEEFSSKIELAIKETRDDLAEAAISQQFDIEAQIPVIESTLKECSKQEKELEGYISALQAQKRQMKDDLRDYKNIKEKGISSEADLLGPGSAGARSATDKKVAKAEAAFERTAE